MFHFSLKPIVQALLVVVNFNMKMCISRIAGPGVAFIVFFNVDQNSVNLDLVSNFSLHKSKSLLLAYALSVCLNE